MKFVKLLTHAYVNGTLRSPAEGVLHLEDDEADRLIENEAGEDVSDDFTAKQDKETPAESVTVETGDEEAAAKTKPARRQG